MSSPERMFDHRLGLALGMSIQEVHALPYPEWRNWYLFSLIEPFGWQDEETRWASLMALMVNINKGKKGKTQKPKNFMRDPAKAIRRRIAGKDKREIFQEATREEKKKTIAGFFSGLIGKSKVKIKHGDSRDD